MFTEKWCLLWYANIKDIVFSLWNDSINCSIFYYFGNNIYIKNRRQTQVIKIKKLDKSR